LFPDNWPHSAFEAVRPIQQNIRRKRWSVLFPDFIRVFLVSTHLFKTLQ
jgi:hypothetical protein